MGVARHATSDRARVDFACELNSPVASLATREGSKSFHRPVRRRGVRQLFSHWAGRGFLILMLVGSGLITAMSIPYFDFETLPAFVIEKLPMRFEPLWLGSLRVHVASALLGFPLCLALMTRTLQRRALWHRWIGRATGVLVLFALVPSGVVLSFDAKGGRVVTAGFLLSAAIVAGAMIAAVRAARRRDLISHARGMRHVVGQMSVAVVSRALIVGFDAVGVSPGVAYIAALWGPVLGSVAVVEWMSRRSMIRNQNNVQLVERTLREIFQLALVVRVRALVRPLARLGR
jgi:Predicted membrane protein (DUF2306)